MPVRIPPGVLSTLRSPLLSNCFVEGEYNVNLLLYFYRLFIDLLLLFIICTM